MTFFRPPPDLTHVNEFLSGSPQDHKMSKTHRVNINSSGYFKQGLFVTSRTILKCVVFNSRFLFLIVLQSINEACERIRLL